MDENNRKGAGIFYAVVGVATLVVAIIGATFAYFSATAENTTDVKGTTATGANLTLTVTRVSDAATVANMVPMEDTDLQKGVTGEGGKSCVDKNGNTVCQVYKVNIANGSNIAVNVKGTMTLNGGGATNMKWQVLTDATHVNDSAETISAGAAGVIIANQALTGEGNQDFYIVVWLEETGADQTDPDAGKSFTGSITFNGVNADGSATNGVTASFSA
ncbi:MAG: hypothetical protein ACI4VL_03030 [Bacilli bacterium]